MERSHEERVFISQFQFASPCLGVPADMVAWKAPMGQFCALKGSEEIAGITSEFKGLVVLRLENPSLNGRIVLLLVNPQVLRQVVNGVRAHRSTKKNVPRSCLKPMINFR
jgi:hypothetical protein